MYKCDKSRVANRGDTSNLKHAIFECVKVKTYHLFIKCDKSCVAKQGRYMSNQFTCNIRVRQGENISPFLFAIYLNDFQQSIGNSYKGSQLYNTFI